jgi:tetratricopeptide (TPR) repeat protein
VSAGDLPRWVKDEIARAASKDRRDAVIRLLEKGVAQFADERYRPAIESLGQAKALAPRSSTIRELLGLANYYAERWLPALQELRAFRRLTGESTQMPVEMDSLRALGRNADVDKTWEAFREVDSNHETKQEAAVVYASHLLDQGRVADAWKVIRPGRLVSPATEPEVRRWFVAARVALAAHDKEAAQRLITAIERENSSIAGLEDLKAELSQLK